MGRVLRDLKVGELTLKDMSTLREADSAKVQAKKTNGVLRDYSLQHLVTMAWNPEHRTALLPFTLYLDDDEYTLSWTELRDLDRTGFFRRETDFKTYQLKIYNGPKVILDVGLNDDAQRDMIVRLCAEDKEVYLDWYQALRLGRFI